MVFMKIYYNNLNQAKAYLINWYYNKLIFLSLESWINNRLLLSLI